MKEFNLSNEIDKDKTFIVMRSSLEERLDPSFYSPYFDTPKGVRFNPLKLVTESIVHPPEYPRMFSDSGYQLIRSQNVRPLGISINENPVYFSEEFLSDKKIVLAQKGDVLVVRSGVNAGDTSVIEDDLKNTIIGADTLLCKCSEKLIPKFLQAYFFTELGRKQMVKHTTGATNKHLNSANLKKILIPDFSIEKQELAISIYEEKIASKQTKESDAQILLDRIDDYLLKELGIALPEQDNSLANRIFMTAFNRVSGGRFDPKVYDNNTQALYQAIEGSKLDKAMLTDLITHSAAGDWGKDVSLSLPEEEYKRCLVVRATEFNNIYNLDIDGKRAKYRLIKLDKLNKLDIQVNDFLIEKSGGSPDQPVGRIALLRSEYLEEDELCYSNFIHKFRVDIEKAEPEYLFAYLKTMHNIKITEAMQSQTNGIRNLIMKEYFSQTIVLPQKEKQIEIANKIQELRRSAKQLQKEADDEMEEAKKLVEKMILEN